MYYFIKTQNPRPTFNLDMTSSEREIMNQHIAFWSDKATREIAIVFGPVMDPHGVYGIGVIKAKNEQEIQLMLDQDPAKGLLKYEVLPMARAIVAPSKAQP